ncbi:alkaline phosphatase [Chaetomidium leptoderma]|uniref:Alkaline phosphatase n=1 Tax=Chaetomidium leptoderma TaxID=669021 RepID=A0AAN6VKB4_9PEZI|nr:alkaline phosphatase [Chaetomidium leptoderma]
MKAVLGLVLMSVLVVVVVVVVLVLVLVLVPVSVLLVSPGWSDASIADGGGDKESGGGPMCRISSMGLPFLVWVTGSMSPGGGSSIVGGRSGCGAEEAEGGGGGGVGVPWAVALASSCPSGFSSSLFDSGLESSTRTGSMPFPARLAKAACLPAEGVVKRAACWQHAGNGGNAEGLRREARARTACDAAGSVQRPLVRKRCGYRKFDADAKTTDPPLIERSSSIKSYTTSHATYPKLRVFYRRHQHADNLPTSPAPVPLLVFIHGLGGSVAQFNPLLTSLTPIASCLAVDLPGCGVSEFEPRNWDAYSANAIVELLETVIEDHRDVAAGQGVVLIGHSMGSSLAALLANPRDPKTRLHKHVLGLVAICPTAGQFTQDRVRILRAALCIPGFIFDLWRAWDRRGGLESPSVRRFVGSDADAESKRLQHMYNCQSKTPVWRRMAWGAVPTYSKGVPSNGIAALDVWAGLDIPVFLVGGADDQVVPPGEVDKIASVLTDKKPESPPTTNGNGVGQITVRAPATNGTAGIPDLPLHPKKVVVSTKLPSPAGHGLLYAPPTVPILAGLISDFLSSHITGRLSLGWQLQYLCRDGKWDVKNLEKWRNVAPVSAPIGGVFRAIKTLREVDEEHCPRVFVQKWGGIIKDVIDISHDNPVYDPRGLEQGGIHYHKYGTLSKVPPNDAEIEGFIDLVDKIRADQKEQAKAKGWDEGYVVGVHCHYGFNRTGFLIACYLVERCGLTAKEAIEEFAKARPNGIRHEHFRDRLYVRYSGSPRSERSPLLADRPRNSEDSTRRAEEEDAALHGTALPPSSSGRTTGLREVVLFAWALLATAGVIVLAVVLQHRNSTSTSPSHPLPPITPGDPAAGGPWSTTTKKPKRNLIFMVSDGMGPASLSLTRSFRQFTASLPIDDVLTLDAHFWGTSRTRSSNSLVTDSAAGATAFSCGRKSYNGAISTVPGFRPCGTMDEIALQEVGEGPLGRSVDLILGGGRCHFLANGTQGSCRADDVDVVGIAKEKHGWEYKNDRAGFDELRLGRNVSLPMLGLFASGDVPFEIDRRNMADVYPSLSEMATTALTALEEATKDSDQGFFLMIEGSRIDHAGHINDPAAQVREVLEYDKAFKIVVDFLKKSDTEGVLVATSDHETGGLSTAWQAPNELPVYNWYPTVLAKANASAEYCSFLLRDHIATAPQESKRSLIGWINEALVTRRLGITDALEAELTDLATNPELATVIFSRMVSERAHIGWSTHGHSAVDVNIYSSGGAAAEKIRGNVENTDVGKFLSEYLDVDVEEITKELEEKLKGRPAIGHAEAQREGEDVAETGGHPVEWLKQLA